MPYTMDCKACVYKILQDALEEISHGHDEYAAKASGMATKMDTFDTFFGLKLVI